MAKRYPSPAESHSGWRHTPKRPAKMPSRYIERVPLMLVAAGDPSKRERIAMGETSSPHHLLESTSSNTPQKSTSSNTPQILIHQKYIKLQLSQSGLHNDLPATE
eukprot:scaffold92201_cov35-Tisochrysis_lutea.AAC.2